MYYLLNTKNEVPIFILLIKNMD